LFGTVGAFVLLALGAIAVVSWASGSVAETLGLEKRCADRQFACGTLIELVTTVLAGTLAFVSFMFWRSFRVVRQHLRQGREEPWNVVPTATPMHVVGREGICEIIEEHLSQPDVRRPQIIVAGVGEGKTAVLVRLAQMLAERGAVPVAVHLRDAEHRLDFLKLACDQFTSCVDRHIFSEDEGDKVWRKFRSEGRIVVLADGLEEALLGNPERHRLIRQGIEKAYAEGLPLVIASRPDEVLDNVDAAVIGLEPLAAADAVEYIGEGPWRGPKMDVAEFVERAGVIEAPLFLQLAWELRRLGRLEPPGEKESQLTIRTRLLDSWHACLCKGLVREGAANPGKERKLALDGLGEMAYGALIMNTLEVELDDEKDDDSVVASVGAELDLVERVGNAIRFRHSVMQAYLGSGQMRTQFTFDNRRTSLTPYSLLKRRARAKYLTKGLEKPSREFLMALVIYCNRSDAAPTRAEIRERLRRAVLQPHPPDQAFDLLAAAYQVALASDGEGTDLLAETAKELWLKEPGASGARGRVKVDEAKLRAVQRMQDAGDYPTYAALWEICLTDQVYRVRLAAAQALAAGREEAHAALRPAIDESRGLIDELATGGSPSRAAVRRGSMLGWILPSLLETCGPPDSAQCAHVREALKMWVEGAGEGLHLGVESCFAQGFKHAANRLPGRAEGDSTALIDMALQLFDSTSWWYSRLTLVQALALWSLELDDADRQKKIGKRIRSANKRAEHPFVRRAALLASKAAKKSTKGAEAGRAKPSKFIWIDETGVVMQIGAPEPVSDLKSRADVKSGGGLWIPPAAGWRTLDPPARRLVGDALVYLNLIEGGEGGPGPEGGEGGEDGEALDAWRTQRSQEREENRQRVAAFGSELPPCIRYPVHRKRLLRPIAEDACCGCPFRLCPYPARNERPFRGEISETFCREQKRILRSGWFRVFYRRFHEGQFEKFWTAMEKRVDRIRV
jgi:hypothetical protein